MAEKKAYVGSSGPFLFDDTELVDDPDGDFAAETQAAFLTDGQMRVGTAPSDSKDVVRLSDLTTSSEEAEMFAYFCGLVL